VEIITEAPSTLYELRPSLQTNTLQAIPDFDDSILKYQKKFI